MSDRIWDPLTVLWLPLGIDSVTLRPNWNASPPMVNDWLLELAAGDAGVMKLIVGAEMEGAET